MAEDKVLTLDDFKKLPEAKQSEIVDAYHRRLAAESHEIVRERQHLVSLGRNALLKRRDLLRAHSQRMPSTGTYQVAGARRPCGFWTILTTSSSAAREKSPRGSSAN